jgi:hypothetical protein
MNFSDHRGLVAVLLQDFLELLLVVVEFGVVVAFAVLMTVLAGEQGRSRRSADGVADISPVESHALIGDAINVRRQVEIAESTTVGTDRLIGMVIGIEPKNVRLLSGCDGQAGLKAEGECEATK